VPTASNANFTRGLTIANLAITRLSPDGALCVGSSRTTDIVIDLSGTFRTEAFDALDPPQRLADSRPGTTTDDGLQAGFGRMSAGTTRTIPIAGRSGLAGDARTVAVNVTAVNPSSDGYLTLYPCGTRPTASSLNFSYRRTIAGALLTKLSATGNLCVYTSQATDLVVDVSGTPAVETFLPLAAPKRLVDSRPGRTTSDGQAAGFGRMAAGTTLSIQVAGRVGLPAAGPSTGGGTYALTITAVKPSQAGYITAYACSISGARPQTSTVNYSRGITIANASLSMTSVSAGRLCVYTSAATDLVIDVTGTLR
jgi:hypothetical protein